MADDLRIKVKNMSRFEFGFIVTSTGFRRIIPGGATIKIDKDILEEAMYEFGIAQAFKSGTLQVIEAPEFIERVEMTEEMPKDAIDEKEIRAILKGGKATEINKMMKGATESMKDIIEHVIITEEDSSPVVVKLAKEILGFDVLKGLQNKADTAVEK